MYFPYQIHLLSMNIILSIILLTYLNLLSIGLKCEQVIISQWIIWNTDQMLDPVLKTLGTQWLTIQTWYLLLCSLQSCEQGKVYKKIIKWILYHKLWCTVKAEGARRENLHWVVRKERRLWRKVHLVWGLKDKIELAGNSMCLFVRIDKGAWLGRVKSMHVDLRWERPCRDEEQKESQSGWSIVKKRSRRMISSTVTSTVWWDTLAQYISIQNE